MGGQLPAAGYPRDTFSPASFFLQKGLMHKNTYSKLIFSVIVIPFLKIEKSKSTFRVKNPLCVYAPDCELPVIVISVWVRSMFRTHHPFHQIAAANWAIDVETTWRRKVNCICGISNDSDFPFLVSLLCANWPPDIAPNAMLLIIDH